MEREHQQTVQLLPWYVNDTLAGRDAELVLKHLAHCDACQAERDRLYQLQQLVQESDSPIDTTGETDYELSYRRTMRRIESAERDRRSSRDLEQPVGQNRYAPLGLAASFLLMLFAAGAWLNNAGSSGDEFQTLSSDLTNSGKTQRMELGFVSPIPAATMRQALIETDSNIVSGPDKSGNYLIEVVVPGHVSNTDYLSRIKQIEGVEHARFTPN